MQMNQNARNFVQPAAGPSPWGEIETLAVRAAAGERACEAALIVAFKPLIVKLAAPFPDYEDARADGVLWTLEAVRAFDPGRGVSFTVYLKRSLTGRYRARWRRFSAETVPFEDYHGSAADNVAQAERAAEQKRVIGQIAAAIPELSELERAIITCAFGKGMSRKAIAEARGIAPETVKTAKKRAMQKLRKKFKKI